MRLGSMAMILIKAVIQSMEEDMEHDEPIKTTCREMQTEIAAK